MTEVRTPRSDAHPRYELVGPRGAPVVVALGGISATRHVTASDGASEPGWWEAVVGSRRGIDTTRLRVLGMDWLDAPGDGVTSAVSTHAQADALARALDAIGVEHALAVVGSSYGGMVALAFAERYPARVGKLVIISAAHRSHPMTTGLRTVQRRIVRLGMEHGHASESLALARALAMITYRSAREFGERFSAARLAHSDDGIQFDVESYLMYHGKRFASHFDPRRFLVLSLSADLHRIDPRAVAVPALLVAAERDSVVPESQMAELSRRLAGPVSVARLTTRVGHDAFLVETAQVNRIVGSALHS